ncbi:hypothetical protein [Actinocrispum wychmicini]|uniref:AraC-like ligand-binding domain-containing protein n=1 Tax=Actinocrispum wychmicini TaxID=1213861 RepID=UPI001A9EEC37|nr:hypothetical protein [Actinocrispum wychmicini]
MIETVFRTSDLPVADRLSAWRELVAGSLIPSTVVSDESSGFLAEMRSMDFGDLQLRTMRLPELESLRTARLIRRSDPEQFQLAVPLSGKFVFSQAGRDSRFGPGHLSRCGQPHVRHPRVDGSRDERGPGDLRQGAGQARGGVPGGRLGPVGHGGP